MDCSCVTLFDNEAEFMDICDDDISQSTKEKVAVAKAYFAEYYFDLIDYLGSVKKRHKLETPSEPNELRTRRFTSRSVPPLFRFGDTPTVVSTVKRKEKRRLSSSLIFEENYSSSPSSSSSATSSPSPSRGDTLRNLNKILSKPLQKDVNKRKAYTLQFKESDKILLEETKKQLAEKEHMTDVAAQVGKSLLAKVEEYEQQIAVLTKKADEDERALQRLADFQSEVALWKEKYAALTEKALVLESQNVRLEEQLVDFYNKEEHEKVKPVLMRHRSLISNMNDLELLKDEIATCQAAENTYKRQVEIATKKNHDYEKEIKRLKRLIEESTNAIASQKANDHQPQNGNDNKNDLLLIELGVSYRKGISLLERLLHKMVQIEKDSMDLSIQTILSISGKWIEGMKSESRPLAFKSLASKLQECGITSSQTNNENTDFGDQQSMQSSTLLLMSLVLLQITTQSEDKVAEWKSKAIQSETEVQELRTRVNTLAVTLQTKSEEIKRENEEKRKKLRDAEVNVNIRPQEHKATNTDNITKTQAEKGVNTDGLMQEKKERQEIEQLRKELIVLKEELSKVNETPSPRVIVTPWEKNCIKQQVLFFIFFDKLDHSELQRPLLQYINVCLQDHPYLSHVLPADPDRHVNRATYDGVLLCSLVNFAHPGIIDERVVNFIPASDLEVKQNFILTINTAMAMGCAVPTTNPDLLLANPHFMLDLLYQLVKCEVFRKINLEHHPELVRLRKEDESPSKFRFIGPSEMLQRWAGYHYKASSSAIPFISSQPLSATDLHSILSSISGGESTSSDWISDYASRIGLQRPSLITTSLVGNIALQILFIAQTLHAASCLPPLSDDEMKIEVKYDADPEGTREERAFVTWINGLGIPMFVSNLQYDMNDGLVLLHTLDKIERGCINWKEVNKQPNNAYKKAENCNLALKTCVNKLNFSLVGIGGKDILDGNRKFILAVAWQACKYHLLSALRTCGDGVEVTESDVLSFLNKRIPQPISSFKDPSLKTGLPLLDLLLHLAPEVVKQENIKRRWPLSPADCLLNAKYAVGLARKIFVVPTTSSHSPPPLSLSSSITTISPSTPTSNSGNNLTAPIHPFGKGSPRPSTSSTMSSRKQATDIPLCLPMLPEDIVEVNFKMLFVFVAMMMLVDKHRV